MADAQIYQARFLNPGNDFNGVGKGISGALEENMAVLGFAQGKRRCNPHVFFIEPLQTLSEHPQALHPAFNGGVIEVVETVETGGQTHTLFVSADNLQPLPDDAGNDHVKAVGTQVNRGDFPRFIHRCITHSFVCSLYVFRRVLLV